MGESRRQPLYTSPPGWTGLQVLEPRVWLQPAGWRAPVGSRHVSMSRHGVTAALALAQRRPGQPTASGLAGAGSMEAQRLPDGINHRGRTAAAGAGRSFRCRDRRTSTSGDRAVGECGTRAAAWAWPATEPSSTKLAHEEEEGSRNQPKTARKMRKAHGFFFPLAQRLQAPHG